MRLKQFKEEKDEIYLHKYGRVLTANESHYRLAGLPRGELKPSVTRLGFFVPEKKAILLKKGEVPTQKKIMEQIENTPYYLWFCRNKLEHDIIEEIQHLLEKKSSNHEELRQVQKEIHRKLGYDCLDVKRVGDTHSVLTRLKDISGKRVDFAIFMS